ncbi:hypothetical protein GCM10025867_17990 [Frondihabitans sucicola]|uniref:Uncharacterized protein n=1 Tax=Frondihabitans sucicola TaxID=1268041 RepID=A0ABN6XX44_9MICO|nr:hypothetical protein [Frondihabitans sucicola]BDZ49558.1 hypothetical protein GCM10025867_17990 [Frondihabitans sucicola]
MLGAGRSESRGEDIARDRSDRVLGGLAHVEQHEVVAPLRSLDQAGFEVVGRDRRGLGGPGGDGRARSPSILRPRGPSSRRADEPALTPRSAESVDGHDSPEQRFAGTRDELEHLGRHDRPHGAAERAEHPDVGARFVPPVCGRLRVEIAVVDVAVVGRSVPEDTDLPVEPRHAPPDDGESAARGLVGDEIARVERVAAVEHDVVVVEDRGARGVEPERVHANGHVAVDGAHPVGGGAGLGRPDLIGPVEDLALKVGDVHSVVIDDSQDAHTALGEILDAGAAEAAGPDDEYAGVRDPRLTIETDLSQS